MTLHVRQTLDFSAQASIDGQQGLSKPGLQQPSQGLSGDSGQGSLLYSNTEGSFRCMSNDSSQTVLEEEFERNQRLSQGGDDMLWYDANQPDACPRRSTKFDYDSGLASGFGAEASSQPVRIPRRFLRSQSANPRKPRPDSMI